jgi:inosine-uridine nucleoside N-ribohydrolase
MACAVEGDMHVHVSENCAQVPDAVDLYRELLAEADDLSVTIAAIGFATNLAGLVESAPDSHSSLTGQCRRTM